MNHSWLQRVSQYVDSVHENIETIDAILKDTKIETDAGDPTTVNACSDELTAALSDLGSRIAERQALLEDEHAPESGSTLTEKLKRCGEPGSELVLTRCESAAERIAVTNQRAISIFVCQYHLADFSAEILRVLSGASAPPTYGGQSVQESGGGSLFNEAA